MVSARTPTDAAVVLFDCLSQPTRLDAYRLLARYRPFGLSAGDIARLLAVPHNTMSSHLAYLERAGLVASRREGRSIIYAARTAPLAGLLNTMLAEVGSPEAPGAAVFPELEPVAETPSYNVLIVCSGNSARSIMAEAILNREGHGRFRAYSAGSKPKKRPNPEVIELLESLGYETADLASKSWSDFGVGGAPPMDFIVTVCDEAAGEDCPAWPGHPLQAHWGIPDPLARSNSAGERRQSLLDAYRRLSVRLTAFVNLPVGDLDLAALKRRLAAIGAMDGATELALAAAAQRYEPPNLVACIICRKFSTYR
jgi:arsenate reductase